MKQLSILFRGTLGFPFPVSRAFALCLLLLASCGGDDSSDEGYAAIESGIGSPSTKRLRRTMRSV